MLDFGFSEILLTSAIALVVLGPERLPKVARQVGNWMGRARSMARQLSEQLEREVSADELLKEQNKSRAPASNRTAPPSLMQPLPPSQTYLPHEAPAGPASVMPLDTPQSPGTSFGMTHEGLLEIPPGAPPSMQPESFRELPPGAPPSMQREWSRQIPPGAAAGMPHETPPVIAPGAQQELARETPPYTPAPHSTPDAQASHPPNE